MFLHLTTTTTVLVKNRNYSSHFSHLITLYKTQMTIEQNWIRGYDEPKWTGEEIFVACFKILPWQEKLGKAMDDPSHNSVLEYTQTRYLPDESHTCWQL